MSSHPPESLTDEQLIQKYTETQENGFFEELYHRYHSRVYAYLCRYAKGDSHAAEDLVQDVFLRVHQFHERFDRGSVQAWLFTVAANRAANAHAAKQTVKRGGDVTTESLTFRNTGAWESFRDQYTKQPIDHRESKPETCLLNADEHEKLRALVEFLPPAERSIVDAAYFRDRSLREIADEQNLPIGTVKSRLNRALNMLRASLDVKPVAKSA